MRQPAWSPDGTKLAFATDQGEGTDLSRLIFGKLKLALFDLETQRVTVLPRQPDRTSRRSGCRTGSRSSSSPTARGSRTSTAWIWRPGLAAALEPPHGRLRARGRGSVALAFGGRKAAPLHLDDAGRLGHLLGARRAQVPRPRANTWRRTSGRVRWTLSARGWKRPRGSPRTRTARARRTRTATARRLRRGTRWRTAFAAACPRRARRARQRRGRYDAGALRAAGLSRAAHRQHDVPPPAVQGEVLARLHLGRGPLASNVGFAGSSVISFSDVLGNHNILAVLNLYGDLTDSDVYLAYTNLSRRTNYGFAVFQYRNDLLLLGAVERRRGEPDLPWRRGLLLPPVQSLPALRVRDRGRGAERARAPLQLRPGSRLRARRQRGVLLRGAQHRPRGRQRALREHRSHQRRPVPVQRGVRDRRRPLHDRSHGLAALHEHPEQLRDRPALHRGRLDRPRSPALPLRRSLHLPRRRLRRPGRHAGAPRQPGAPASR